MIFKPCTGLNGFDMYDGPSSQLCKRRSRSRLVEAPDTGVCLLPKSGKNLPNSLEACYLFSRSDHFNLYYIIIAKLATWSSLCHKVAFSPCASNWRGIGVCLPPMLSIARCSLHEPPRGTSLFYFILFTNILTAVLCTVQLVSDWLLRNPVCSLSSSPASAFSSASSRGGVSS